MKMIPNKYDGNCIACRVQIGIGQGFAYNDGIRWRQVCKSSACHKQMGLDVEPKAPENKLTESGEIIMGYDPNALPLLRSMPGAKWNPDKKRWSVSIKSADLGRVIEVCEKLKLHVPDSLRKANEAGTRESQEADQRAERLRSDGKGLFPFQKEGVKWISLHDRALLSDEQGLGKEQPISEPILTPSGWSEIGKIKTGNYVIGSNGCPVMVTGVYPQGIKDIYRVGFSDGTSTRCGYEHLWRIQYARDRHRYPNKTLVFSTRQIMESGIRDNSGNKKYFIPIVKPVIHTEKKYPIHPYLIGALIANANINDVIIHSGTDEQRSAMFEFIDSDYVFSKCDNVSYRLINKNNINKKGNKPNVILGKLRDLGLNKKRSYEKYIPVEYMTGSVIQRLYLLQGLMDNDGTIGSTLICEYNTTSKVLGEQVAELCRSLGGIARCSTRIPHYSYKGERKEGRMDYRIRIKLPSDMCPFLIKSKANKFVPPTKYKVAKAIDSITHVGKEECVCIMVDSEDHMYVTKDHILTHNTLESLVALPSNQRVIVVCPASVKYNWKNESNLWRPDYKVLVIKTKNDFVLPEEGQIVIVNYDILPDWLTPRKEKNEDGTESKRKTYHIPDEHRLLLSQVTVIADEIHYCKNYKASRSAKFIGLQKHVKRCWGLTGTPLMNRPFDLWGVLSAIGCEKQFASFPKFVDLFNGSRNKWGGYEFGLPTVECSERMKRVMLRRLKSEVLKDLPAKTYQTIMIDELSAKDKKVLDACAKELIDTDEEDGTFEEKISRIDLDSLPSFESFSKIRAMIASSRIPAMIEIVEEYEETETPLVVFSAHRAPIDELAKREGWAVITGDVKAEDRTEIVRRFQAGELKGVGLTISAGGVGLTLTRASHVLFVDKDWTPGNNMQSEDRLHRIGQTNCVLVKSMVSNHPLDIHVHNLIEYKIEMARRALDAGYKYEANKAEGTMNGSMDLIEETQEQRDERVRRATTEAEKAIARDKIKAIAQRESAKVSNVKEPELSEEKKQLLAEALGYMNSVCDGAKKKDEIGFNKADTAIARWFGSAMLSNDDDDLYRTLERILVRYKGQLSWFGIWD
jgi:hypothetical protein